MKLKKIKSIVLGAILVLILPFNVFAGNKVEQGQATVNEAIKSGNKEFYTIVTPSQQTYYLVIDFQEKERNVYFLKAVDEIDLLDLAGVGEVIYNQEETKIETTTQITTEIITEQTTEILEEQQENKEKPKLDVMLILGIGILSVALFLFIKNKKDNKKREDIYLDEAIKDEEEVIFEEEKININKEDTEKKVLDDITNFDL